MTRHVYLQDHAELHRQLGIEFESSPLYSKLNHDNGVQVKAYFDRFLHNKSKEFGNHVFYTKQGKIWGAYVFNDDNEYMIFKLTHL